MLRVCAKLQMYMYAHICIRVKYTFLVLAVCSNTSVNFLWLYIYYVQEDSDYWTSQIMLTSFCSDVHGILTSPTAL